MQPQQPTAVQKTLNPGAQAWTPGGGGGGGGAAALGDPSLGGSGVVSSLGGSHSGPGTPALHGGPPGLGFDGANPMLGVGPSGRPGPVGHGGGAPWPGHGGVGGGVGPAFGGGGQHFRPSAASFVPPGLGAGAQPFLGHTAAAAHLHPAHHHGPAPHLSQPGTFVPSGPASFAPPMTAPSLMHTASFPPPRSTAAPAAPPRGASVILVAGAPRTGKTTLAQRLAAEFKMTFITAATDRWENLSQQIAARGSLHQGIVLDGYGFESHADVHYLQHQLSEYRLGIDFAVYFDLAPSVPRDCDLNSQHMHLHAVSYEMCEKHFSSKPENFALIKGFHDAENRRFTIDEMYIELKKQFNKWRGISASLKLPVQLKPFSDDPNWELVSSYKEMSTIIAELQAALEYDVNDDFPTRGVRMILDYARFVRSYQQLRKYRISTVTSGKRIVVFKRIRPASTPSGAAAAGGASIAAAPGFDVMYLTESREYVMRYKAAAAQPAARGGTTPPPEPWPLVNVLPRDLDALEGPGKAIVFALEAEMLEDVSASSEAAGGGSVKNRHMVIRDCLKFGSRRASEMTRDERNKVILDHFTGQGILVNKSFDIWQADEAAAILLQIRGSGGIGYRFDHPWIYQFGGDDTRLFQWLEADAPITVRLWNSRGKDDGWEFSMLVLDDATKNEVPLVSTMTMHSTASGASERAREAVLRVPFATADALSLNDGQLVDVTAKLKRDETSAGGRGGAKAAGRGALAAADSEFVFTLSRRRNDLFWPMYFSVIKERLAAAPWAGIIKACVAMNPAAPAGAASSTTSSPAGSPTLAPGGRQ